MANDQSIRSSDGDLGAAGLLTEKQIKNVAEKSKTSCGRYP